MTTQDATTSWKVSLSFTSEPQWRSADWRFATETEADEVAGYMYAYGGRGIDGYLVRPTTDPVNATAEDVLRSMKPKDKTP